MMAVVRVRGSVGMRREFKDTLKILNLTRANHLVLVAENDSYLFMLKKVSPYITFGEINEETASLLLEKRGRLLGNKRLGQEFLKEKKIKSFGDLAKGLLGGKISLKELGIKRVFRLRPPKKGFERAGIKKSYSIGGACGYRAGDINELVRKMI